MRVPRFAWDFIHKSIHSKISDHKFPDYKKLLDDMAADPTPNTMTCLPSLAVDPSASRQKRSRAALADGVGDNGAFGSGITSVMGASSAEEAALPPASGPTNQEDIELLPDLVRANAVTAFVAYPLLPDPDQLKVDHMSAILAVNVN